MGIFADESLINYINILLSSGPSYLLSVGEDDRRWFSLDSNYKPMLPNGKNFKEWFEKQINIPEREHKIKGPE